MEIDETKRLMETMRTMISNSNDMLSIADLARQKLLESTILKQNRVEEGDYIIHTTGEVGMVLGVLNYILYVKYINCDHKGYVLHSPFRKISDKEFKEKFGIDTINKSE